MSLIIMYCTILSKVSGKIKKVKIDPKDIESNGVVSIKTFSGFYEIYKLGEDIHYTYDEAKLAAERERAKEIAYYKKRLAELESYTFDIERDWPW